MEKTFFKTNSLNQKKGKDKIDLKDSLVKKILDLDTSKSGVIPSLGVNKKRPNQALKYGEFLKLNKPKTSNIRDLENPSNLIIKGLESLTKINEEDIFELGYEFFCVNTEDSRARTYSFDAIMQATKIMVYSVLRKDFFKQQETKSKAGISVLKSYEDNQNVYRIGSAHEILVPSRTKNKPRYKITAKNVPILDNNHKILLGFNQDFSYTGILPGIKAYDELIFENISHGFKVPVYPHQIAANYELINHLYKKSKIPFEVSKVFMFSKEASIFYDKLENNVLVEDDKKLRNLYRSEKSILLARFIKAMGQANSIRDKARDGDIKSYFNK